MTQLTLFPDLKQDVPYRPLTDKEVKQETADILSTLLAQGFVNVKSEDLSEEHLKDLIHNLRKDNE